MSSPRKCFLNRSTLAASTLLLVVLLQACGGSGGGADKAASGADPHNKNEGESPHFSPGGEASVRSSDAHAFSSHSANLRDTDRILTFNIGNDFFENPWVAGSSSTSSRDGLGPLFNNNACQDCHIRDGRGHAPELSQGEIGTEFSSLLVRAARTDITDDEKARMANSLLPNVGDVGVGGQLQQQALAGIRKEAELGLRYVEREIEFDDGHIEVLREPQWLLTSLYEDSGHDFAPDTVFSARVAPPMLGLGLLALVSESEIAGSGDELDADGDGISGRANFVWSVEEQAVRLGRFGWKAGQASLLEQAAAAFLNDMGLTSRLHKQESCLAHQLDCLMAPNGNGDSVNDYDYEVSDTVLDAVAFYSAHLAVPKRRRPNDEQVLAGAELFEEIGCASCHRPSFVTEDDVHFPELSRQTIFPYTDLLLHDMGDDLADFDRQGRVPPRYPVEFLATTHEWRTPPLWGIGLAKIVDPNASFLHDGRARTIMEAILWHGGEAEPARNRVLSLTAEERQRLLVFIEDL